MTDVGTSKELTELLIAARNLLSNIVFGGSGGVKINGREYPNNQHAARAVLDGLQSAIDSPAHEPSARRSDEFGLPEPKRYPPIPRTPTAALAALKESDRVVFKDDSARHTFEIIEVMPARYRVRPIDLITASMKYLSKHPPIVEADEIERASAIPERTAYTRTTIEGGPCAHCGNKLRDHIAMTDGGVKNACPVLQEEAKQ